MAYKGHIVMILADLVWGLNAPIGKSVLTEISPLALTMFRMGGAAAAFWLTSLFLPKERVEKKDFLPLFFASILGIVINQGLFIFGLSETSPIDASIVCTTLPIMTMIVAAIFLKEPITFKKVAGIIIGASGALILILSGRTGIGVNSSSWLGNLSIFIAQLSVAIYLTLYKGLLTKYSPITVTKWLFLYASICFIPFAFRDVATINYLELPAITYWEIFFVVFLATYLTYIFMTMGQGLLRPTVVSMYNYIQPIVASIVTVYIGMDTFGWNKWLAVLLVFSGVYVVTQSKSRAQLESEKNQSSAKSMTDEK